jgi:cell pole-organizing protein PopZ
MSDSKAQPEPTMEEILASIRRIISENDEESRAAAATARSPAAAPAANDSVLELTEMVAEDGSVVSLTTPFDDALAAAGEDAADEDDGDEIPPLPGDEEEQDVAMSESAEDSEVTMEDAEEKVEFSSEELMGQPAVAPQAGDDGLMSAAAAAAATAAFANLSRATQQSAGGGLSLGSGRTLEDLVQEMIRPMIKDWLDKNLPPMAERLVRKELERLSRRAEE